MGRGMALNLSRKGFALLVYDACLARVEETFPPSQVAAGGLRQLAQECDRIIFCLPDYTILQRVLFGSSSASSSSSADEGDRGLVAFLKPGHVLVDCGTSHPVWTQETERRLREMGITFLDAPVSGMVAKAEAGTLSIMVGGDRSAFEVVEPALWAMGKEVTFLGASGNGQLTKMLNNVLFNVSIAAMAEILPVATRLGLDPQQFSEVVGKGSGQSFGFDSFAGLVLARNFEAGKGGYPLAAAFKDMQTFEELVHARLQADHLPSVVAGTMQTYKEALDKGYGAEHKGAMVKVWEERFGVQVAATADVAAQPPNTSTSA